MDPQFQTVELYGPSDPETGAKSAMDSQTLNGGAAEGSAKAVRAGGSGHVKRSAGTNTTALLGFWCGWRVRCRKCCCQDLLECALSRAELYGPVCV